MSDAKRPSVYISDVGLASIGRRVSRYGQLPETGAAQTGEGPEMSKLTFQVIRRTIATLAQKKGTVKDVQGVLRHSRTATTTDIYMQEIPESVQATVNSISMELRRSQSGTNSRSTAKRVPATATSRGKRSQRAAVAEGVIQNLTPNDTKLERSKSVSI